jgi:hypothetical protein
MTPSLQKPTLTILLLCLAFTAYSLPIAHISSSLAENYDDGSEMNRRIIS